MVAAVTGWETRNTLTEAPTKSASKHVARDRSTAVKIALISTPDTCGTRYRITVIPDFDQPARRCSVEVRGITERRAAEGMKWEPAPENQRPERAKALLETIQTQVK
ncbi:MAG: hypothetical protein ABIP55_00485 [Tepidisphaeraceae bacterium]